MEKGNSPDSRANYKMYDSKKYKEEHKRRIIKNSILSVLICATVAVTYYLLTMPAITWERSLVCELEEHAHSAACYDTVTVPESVELICENEEHVHNEECYQEITALICGQEESGEHEHSEECYSVVPVLVCSKAEHVHGEECYRKTEEHTEQVFVCGKEEHTHSDSCYDSPTVEKSIYSCGSIAHTHNDNCYFSDGTLRCTLPEHEHTDECLAKKAVLAAVSNDGILTSSDLGNFVTGCRLYDRNGVLVSDNTVYVGENYKIEIYFSEDPTSGSFKQFKADNKGNLTYQLDKTHLKIKAVEHKPLLANGIQVGEVSINEEGTVTVTYYRVDNTGAPSENLFFDNYQNTDLYIELDALVDSNDQNNKLRIDLENDVVIEMEAPEVGTLKVTKDNGRFNPSTHSLDYDVIVECGHGVVTDLGLSDTALLTDNSTNPPVQYDLSSGMFSFSGYTITDMQNNPVSDGNGGTVNDISELNGVTLHGGEGYKIHYSVVLAPAFYDAHSKFKASLHNEFEADGLDPDNQPISADDYTDTNNFDVVNLAKNGELKGDITIDGAQYQLICWTVTVGDYNTIQNEPISLIDTLGQAGQHFYFNDEDTEHNAMWQIVAPSNVTPNRGLFSLDSDVTVYTGGETESASFTLPAGGSRYSLIYFTYVERPESGSVAVSNSASISWKSDLDEWEIGSGEINVIGIGDTPTIEKSITDVDDEYLYFKAEALVPGSQYGNHVFIQDELTFDGEGGRFLNDAEIIAVTVENLTTNEVVTLNPYSGSGPVENTFKYYKASDTSNTQRKYFSITFADERYQNSWQNSRWPYDYPVKLTVTYRISRSLPDVTHEGQTINSRLAGSYRLNNMASIYYGPEGAWLHEDDTVHYNEMIPVGKTGSVTDQREGIISFKAAFSNDKLLPGETEYASKVPMLTDGFYNGVFRDDFDSRLEYVEDSLYVFLYQRNNTVASKNLVTDFGRQLPCIGVFKYTGSNITDTGISALWKDFTAFDYTAAGLSVANPRAFLYTNGSISYRGSNYRNMEELLQDYPDVFGLVFSYDMRVKTQYRESLSDTASVLRLVNEAGFGWDTPAGHISAGEASVVVNYGTEIITKEHTPEDGDIDRAEPIHYIITVNPYGYDLTEKNSLMLEDTMCDSLKLMLATVVVEEGRIDEATGETVWTAYPGDPQIAYNPAENKLTAVIPDDRPMRLRYDCKISGAAGTVTLSNSVSIEGFAEIIDEDVAAFSVHGSSTATSGSNEKMYLKKISSATHTGLPDAVFALYGNNSSFQHEAPDGIDQTLSLHNNMVTLYYYGQYTTGAFVGALDGSAEILDTGTLEHKGLYAIRELQAPEGFVLDPQLHEFYWNDFPNSFIEDIPVLEDGDTLYIENSPETVSLPATGGVGDVLFSFTGTFLLSLSVLGLLPLIRKRKTYE